MASPRQHASPTPSSGDEITIIGRGIVVQGQINGEEDLRIEGRVDGSISLTETVYVAESGVVVATVEARDVVVSGVLVGNVSASNSISLDPGAKLVGDIDAPRVIIADGAAFRGNVRMGDLPPGARVSRASTPKARPAARTRPASGASPAASRAAPASRKAERSAPAGAAPRVAAVRGSRQQPDDEVTVVVRHSALDKDEETPPPRPSGKKKSAKKSPPRGRVPKPGKRRVNRR